jgi:hypothetical protein
MLIQCIYYLVRLAHHMLHQLQVVHRLFLLMVKVVVEWVMQSLDVLLLLLVQEMCLLEVE